MTEAQAIKRFWHWVNHPALVPFGFQSWKFDVSVGDEPDGKVDANASIACASSYNWAEVIFRRGYIADVDPETFDTTCVHELMHAAMRNLNQVEHIPCSYLSPVAEELYHERLDHEQEQFIDNLSRALVAAEKTT